MKAERSTGTFRLWLHPADRRTRAQAFALHLVLVVAFYSMEALRLARRHLLLLRQTPATTVILAGATPPDGHHQRGRIF